jgi:hypothetical protein
MSQLGLNLPLLLAQVINLIVLVALRLPSTSRPGMLTGARARREGLQAADRPRANAEASRRCPSAGWRRQGQALVAQADAANRSGGRAHRPPRGRSASERARGRYGSRAGQAIAELREAADLTVSAAEKVIGQSLASRAANASSKRCWPNHSRRAIAADQPPPIRPGCLRAGRDKGRAESGSATSALLARC